MATARYLPYAVTRRYTALVLDYLSNKEHLQNLHSFRPDAKGLAEALQQRTLHPVDRETLHSVLKEQYEHLPFEQAVEDNRTLLIDEKTFTVCTAHQPNLATGYLYFIYKILHAIKLAAELKAQHPQYNFVPVYYMGSEDADLEELGTFRFGDRKFVWDAAGQTGAVGRMKTASLAPLLQQLSAVLGPPGEFARELEHLLHEAYLKHENISRATQYLVHSLFGKYGLLVLDPDDARLKRCFLPVMEEDLLSHTAEHLAGDTNEVLVASGYKAQAQPRNINLFYLKDNLRERIAQTDDCWLVLNTDIQWDKATLLEELHEHPERFSPNVMLRPLYQETILPNVAFIGGGAEVAYWLQLRSLFQHHKVFYPTILLRQSVMWMSADQKRLMSKTGLSHESVFLPKDEAVKAYLVGRMDGGWQLPEEHDQLEVLLSTLREKATAIDPTLQRSADATLARMKHQLDALESKMLRALKRKEHIAVSQIERLQQQLFPGGGLAERVENFMPYYIQHGPSFFEILLRCIRPLSAQFLIIESEH